MGDGQIYHQPAQVVGLKIYESVAIYEGEAMSQKIGETLSLEPRCP